MESCSLCGQVVWDPDQNYLDEYPIAAFEARQAAWSSHDCPVEREKAWERWHKKVGSDKTPTATVKQVAMTKGVRDALKVPCPPDREPRVWDYEVSAIVEDMVGAEMGTPLFYRRAGALGIKV